MKTAGRSLELFFINGRPDGMLTAEVFNWTGHVLRIPRTQLKEALLRDEATFTGVYFLLGEIDDRTHLYIGEAEDIGQRLKEHAARKDWWNIAILVTSTANNLHKAHVKYLESRLVEIAASVGLATLDNGNVPPRSSLSEAAKSDMEGYLENLMMVLPAIRVDAFLDKKRRIVEDIESLDTNHFDFQLNLSRHNLTAQAILRNGEMIVLRGSDARHCWLTKGHNYEKLYDQLVADKTIVINGDQAHFERDYAFTSPSAAAAIVTGRPSNGRREWINVFTGKNYHDWEVEYLSSDLEIS